jgi:Mg2+/Co2+ transporter CorB
MIPEKGQAFTFHGFRFEVVGKKRNQITRLRITPVTAAMKSVPLLLGKHR